jgi:hypothetical protein
MISKFQPFGDVTTDQIVGSVGQLSQLGQTYQEGGLTAVVKPALPYLVAYGLGIALASAILTTIMVKKTR